MKKVRNGFIKNLHYLCLIGVVAFGLITIVGSNGGGGGGDTGEETGGQAGLTYTGLTSQSLLDSGNSLALAVGAYDGGKTGSATGRSPAQANSSEDTGLPRTLKVSQALEDSLRQIDFTSKAGGRFIKAIYTESDTVEGDCGGSAAYSISVNDQTGYFSGTFTYNNYCSGGVTIDGSVTYSGQYDVNTGYLLTFDFSFDNLTSTAGNESFTLDGDISWDVSGSSASLTMNMLMQDNSTGKVYWVKDYSMTLTVGVYEVEFEISGEFYDPDYGYVSISTPEPFVFGYGDYYPYEGVLVITGAPGSAGGNTKARLTVLSSTTLKVEADTDGDGIYDWDSGVIGWSDV